MEKMNLKWLKEEMWIEVCEGEVIEMNNEYKELLSDISDDECSGVKFIESFYIILDRLVENNLIEMEYGDYDLIYNYLERFGEEDNFEKYLNEYNGNN